MAFWMSLFRNEQENDSQPIYTNRKVILKERIILEADTPYEVAMWRKTKTADGKPVDMVSIKVEENDFLIAKMHEEENSTSEKPKALDDDDIPF
tara:strand:- start:816 stop:1097 length:282 start_codon:yes stop_codon:yes gene_type:complete